MKRFAAIDVGTNSVLLLVAERQADGSFTAVRERAEITRLGRGVDASRRLHPDAIADTTKAIADFVSDAKTLGAQAIAITATSAARDATNGHEFLSQVKATTGISVDIISGDEEARLSFLSAYNDFGRGRPLVVIDIGGGSTEFIFGSARGEIEFKKSFDVGSVRLTERLLRSDPPAASEIADARAHLQSLFAELKALRSERTLIGIAGTVTTLLSMAERMQTYDPTRVHGAQLTQDQVSQLATAILSQPVSVRKTLPGLQPKRADVIAAGALILDEALRALQIASLTVSDRGLRWGLLVDRFGAQS